MMMVATVVTSELFFDIFKELSVNRKRQDRKLARTHEAVLYSGRIPVYGTVREHLHRIRAVYKRLFFSNFAGMGDNPNTLYTEYRGWSRSQSAPPV